MDDAVLTEIDGKFYATARAYIIESPEDLPREMATEFNREDFNPSFLWIAGRFVQANKQNQNGHFWTLDDLEKGESTIRHTPMNVLHQYQRPVGTFVETKIVHRQGRADATDELLPEIQALGVLWAASFPKVAEATRQAHAAGTLWYSMECVAEAKQCLTCNEVFPFQAQGPDVCEHMALAADSPRRFINPVFLGGALVFPPAKPAWTDAEITEVARDLTSQFAHRDGDDSAIRSWELVMDQVLSLSG